MKYSEEGNSLCFWKGGKDREVSWGGLWILKTLCQRSSGVDRPSCWRLPDCQQGKSLLGVGGGI